MRKNLVRALKYVGVLLALLSVFYAGFVTGYINGASAMTAKDRHATSFVCNEQYLGPAGPNDTKSK
jgi:hypothetical protein